MVYQRTLKKAVFFSGIGLHTGEVANVSVKPASEDYGIVFYRTDVEHEAEVRATVASLNDVNFSIALKSNGVSVKTVEHLLAAMAGMGIDNAIVELDGPEVPGMDGSAKPFVEIFRKAGIAVQSKAKKFIKIKRPIEIVMGNRFAMVLPYPVQKISYTIGYAHPILTRQRISFNVDEAYFVQEIASARTFGFLKDAEKLKALGLAKGVSLDNSIVIGEERILNGGLRYHDEFVRHKALDLIGDMSLVGWPIIGHFIAVKSGHYLNTLLCSKVYEETSSWELVESSDSEESIYLTGRQYPVPELAIHTF